ncbi:ABC transporter ATP-binding protein [Clostridium culturomicium]|uniref:ABC transporter ATP-binding protein n=1 Tax=Clostridium culturomicium TaxID=1499683 RepID=UPI0005908386|nr:ABC transporter ATP-binding protein [Clostridium culturomicium]
MAKNTVNQDEKVIALKGKDILFRLVKYMKPYGVKIAAVLLLMLIVTGVGLLSPMLLKIAIDDFIGAKDVKGLALIGAGLIGLNLISMYASKYATFNMNKTTHNILRTIRQELYEHIQKLSFAFFDERPVGKILARVVGDVNSLSELFNKSVTTVIPQVLTLVFVTIIMFSMNVKLALVSMAMLPPLCVGLAGIQIISRKRWQVFRQKRSNLNGFTHESFSGMRIIQNFTFEKESGKRFKNSVGEMRSGFINAVKLNDWLWPIVEVSFGASTLIVFLVGANLARSAEVSIGTITAFISYTSMFWRPILNIASYYNTLITNFAAAERIFEIMDVKPGIDELESADVMPKIKGRVEFENVSFAYEKDTQVLHNVSFKVKPGENIALVGPTGAGKTTITSLISRFYDTTEGRVLIDGKDVSKVNLNSLRSQMGVMLQDTFLFSDSIKENIRYGKLDATDEEIIAAAKAVSAHDFIMKLEKGYDTQVNERGSRLSVGQRQLISFARALLANPRILILDEATSNIDTATEILVQKGINKLLSGRTSFVIAHRLSTIRDCDRIMVIDDGEIVEAGTHEELLNLRGAYYKLYMAQYSFLREGA